MALASQSPVPDERGPLVIRPSWASLGRWERHILGLVVVGMGLLILRLLVLSRDLSTVALVLGATGFLAGCGAVYMTAYMVGTRITVTADGILVTHWFRSTATVSTRDIARVVRCSVTFEDPANARPAVFALSPTGKCVLSLYAERWDQGDLDRIWKYVGVSPEGTFGDVVLDQNLGSRFPGAF
jgi:hypothetical protein